MKKPFTILTIAIIALLGIFASCKKKDKSIAVTEVTLSQPTAGLTVGDTITLTETVLPQNATDKTVTWTSSNPAVASVENGRIIALTEGTTNITVTTQNGNKTATCVVTVGPAPTPIFIQGIRGVTVPSQGIPTGSTTITETAQFTGTITWNPEPDNDRFQRGVVYTATITLTPKPGFTLNGVAANFFVVEGADLVENSANSGVVSARFPITTMPTNISSIPGVTPPVAGEVPVTTITETEHYTGTVAWEPTVDDEFEYSTTYTAVITLTPKEGFRVSGNANFYNVAGAVSTTNSAGSNIVRAVFPPTADPGAATITILAHPDSVTNVTQGSITETLTVAALVDMKGRTLTYQWYVSVHNNWIPVQEGYPSAVGVNSAVFEIPKTLTSGMFPSRYDFLCEVGTTCGATPVRTKEAIVWVHPVGTP